MSRPRERSDSDDEREAERRVLDVVRDLFTVLDAHGYQRTSNDAALARAWPERSSRCGSWSTSTRGTPTTAPHARSRTDDVHTTRGVPAHAASAHRRR